MSEQNKNEYAGEISRILMEKAKEGFEFGKVGNDQSDDVIHTKRPKSNHKGIDYMRWSD